MKNLGSWLTAFLFIGLGISYLGSITQRSYWKERCFEIQDNYEAISRENEDLRDTIIVLKDSLKVSPAYK